MAAFSTNKTTKITSVIELAQRFTKGEVDHEEFFGLLHDEFENLGNIEDSDLAMEQLAALLVRP